MSFFSKTRILGPIIFYLFATMLLFTSSCQKDLTEKLLPRENCIDLRTPDSEEHAPNHAQLLAIWKDFRQKHTVDEQISFYQRNGFLKWSEARILKETARGNFLFSVPTIKEDQIESVLFAWKYVNDIKYVHVNRTDLSMSTEKILEKYGPDMATMMIMSFLKHEKNFGDYYSGFLGVHLRHPDIQEVLE